MRERLKVGDRVTYTKAYRAQVHDDPRHPDPAWVDQVYTVVEVWSDEWLHTLEAPGEKERRRAGRPVLAKIFDPDIENLL